jgi:hypothetical protein
MNFFKKLDRTQIACDPVVWTQNEQVVWKYLGQHLLRILKYTRKKFATKRRRKAFVSASEAKGVRDLAWLSASRDPDLWRLIAAHANPDLLEKFVGWVIQQPECDRATVAYLFLKLGGPSCFLNPPSGSNSSWSFIEQAVARICNRSEKGDGFPRRELTLSECGKKDDQRDVLLKIRARTGSAESFAPVPVRLLGEVIEGRATDSLDDVLGEGDIVDAI